MVQNLYIHFPFCRRKCSYCALHSRAGVSESARADHVAGLCEAVRRLREENPGECLSTVYFGGGSPALCNLAPLLGELGPLLKPNGETEFTVELHPKDVNLRLLETLRSGKVNRISMGVQSLEDSILTDMGRGYTADEAERAFSIVKQVFDNAGIDLIVGYPNETDMVEKPLARLKSWSLRHCSVYSLILEERSILAHRIRCEDLPGDDVTLDRLSRIAQFLDTLGLRRYEISNYAQAGFECRHNMAVWRGEDYLGLGEGACGRIGLTRTGNEFTETVTREEDAKERRFFRLRTREGLDAQGFPQWLPTLEKFVREGLLTRTNDIFRLTERGTEVCDSILAELV